MRAAAYNENDKYRDKTNFELGSDLYINITFITSMTPTYLFLNLVFVKLFTPDQDRISPHNINIISS